MGGNKCLNVEKANELSDTMLSGRQSGLAAWITTVAAMPATGTGPGLSQLRLLHTVQIQNKVHPYAKNSAQDTPVAEHHQPLSVQ